jgi:3-oxoacyl-[acyl-carrier-protein] synthase III
MPSLASARPGIALGAIAGLGVYRPAASVRLTPRVTGADVTGVAYRVQAEHGITTASLAACAARAALRAGGLDGSELEMIVVGTTTPDVLWPTTACLVQTELQLPMVASFDLYAAESSLLTALNVASRYMSAGARAVLLIGAESDNQLVDLPGQGGPGHGRAAAAAVLTRSDQGAGVLATIAGAAAQAEVDGDAHDRMLLRGVGRAVDECLNKASLSLADVDLVIGEQAAPEITQAWARAHRLAGERLILDHARYGSLLVAAPLVALYDAVRSGRLAEGMTALLLSCGSGPSWAVACIRWSGGGLAEW